MKNNRKKPENYLEIQKLSALENEVIKGGKEKELKLKKGFDKRDHTRI